MNVQTLSRNPTAYLRNAVRKIGAETTLNYDSEERRMEHTSFQKRGILSDFWDVTAKLPRNEQVSLAASVLVQQVAQNGPTTENRTFVRQLGSRFSNDELATLKSIVERHPLLQKRSKSDASDLLQQIETLLKDSRPLQVQENAPTPRLQPRPLSPDEIFFQTTLLKGPQKTLM